ncbi:hypothetical protein [Singulisphaera sp. GP187]|uniref:hypothetical protein n=1 Tax=Singulisphaera sp. GP187 TaxID=1882752 RepID=UPI0013564508|nr:hypothetical protein [Singulisphaera sp. GP187]
MGTGYHSWPGGAYVYVPDNELPGSGSARFLDTAVGSHAMAINNQGIVAGSWQTWQYPPVTGEQPVIWRTGQGISPVVLDPLGRQGIALALNNATQVVGAVQSLDGRDHAFLYDKGVFQDLNDLIPKATGIVLDRAVGIDGQGRIVSYGQAGPFGREMYLLTPTTIPEPNTLAFALLVIAAATIRQLRGAFAESPSRFVRVMR